MSVIYDGDEKDIARISNFGLLVECRKLHTNFNVCFCWLLSRDVSLRGGCGGIGEGRGDRNFTVEDSGGDLTLRTGYLNRV